MLVGDNDELYMYVSSVVNVTSYLFHLAIQRSLLSCFTFHLQEGDAALGNGGLARLSACQMDSLATLDYPVWGYMILTEYIQSKID